MAQNCCWYNHEHQHPHSLPYHALNQSEKIPLVTMPILSVTAIFDTTYLLVFRTILQLASFWAVVPKRLKWLMLVHIWISNPSSEPWSEVWNANPSSMPKIPASRPNLQFPASRRKSQPQGPKCDLKYAHISEMCQKLRFSRRRSGRRDWWTNRQTDTDRLTDRPS